MINFYKENNVPKIQFADGQSVSFLGRVTIAVDNSTGQLIIAEDGHDKFWISTSQTLQVNGANITGTNQQKADLIAPVFVLNTGSNIPANLDGIADTAARLAVSPTEKTTWNNKSNITSYNDLSDKPAIPNPTTDASQLISGTLPDARLSGNIALKTGLDFINVKDYGAVGNGSSDDTTAIFNAISSINTRGGGSLFFPNGTYITATILMPQNVVLFGENRLSTVLKLKNNTNGNIINLYNSDGAGLMNMTLDGNRANNTSGNGIEIKGKVTGIPDGRARYANIENINIQYCVENGIRTYFESWQWYVGNIRVEYCGQYGIYNDASDSSFDNIQVHENDTGGIYETGASMRWSNIKSLYNGWLNNQSGGVVLDTAYRIVFSNVECQDNYYGGFIFNNSSDITVLNSMADANGAAARPYVGGNRNHANFYDPSVSAYAYKIYGCNNLAVYGFAANYISPTGQKSDRYIENSKNIVYRVTVSDHALPGVELGSYNIDKIKNNVKVFNQANVHTGYVVGDVWKKVYSLTSDATQAGNYFHSLAGNLIIGNGFGVGLIKRIPFQVTYKGASTTNASDEVKLYVSGLFEDRIRIVKKATNNYELQMQSIGGVLTGYEIYRSGNTSAGVNIGTYDENQTQADPSDVALYNIYNASPNIDASGSYKRITGNNTQLALTGSTSETTLFTYTIPAGTLSPNSTIRIPMLVSSSTNNANTKTIRIKFNGTTCFNSTAITSTSCQRHEFTITNRNSLTSQITGPLNTNASYGYGGSSGSVSAYSIPFSGDVTMIISAQLAVGTDQVAIEQFDVIVVN